MSAIGPKRTWPVHCEMSACDPFQAFSKTSNVDTEVSPPSLQGWANSARCLIGLNQLGEQRDEHCRHLPSID
jgi:hypothetical protein